MARMLTPEEITRQVADLTGWRHEGASLLATYTSPSFPAAIMFVDDVAEAAEEMQHHPDIDIRGTTTHWTLSTHSTHSADSAESAVGLTQLDIELAHRIAQSAHRGRATTEEVSA
ncbi:4a-hydroxytetrahydrobiopterin dehydratase [Lapillicoccus sp.]|uniref:4a-hydroxytetrahydrobiopterin dehydratase n=1 Tax=Lapillicoccus sp. TaxID=1909287 RepID=UPI0025E1AD29|nr:4a-hydroxytetrahydrobiopterin dehydratase [Lapillicoccus sp.]